MEPKQQKKYSIRLELCVLIILKIYEPKKVFCWCGMMKLRLHDGKKIKKTVHEKDDYKGVDYARLVPLLIFAIKKKKKEVEELKNKK